MDWTQFAILFITFAGLFIWNRTESRADIRHMDSKLESNRNLSIQIHKENHDIIESIRKENQEIIASMRKENYEIITSIREDAREFQKAMAEESKDFHGRLCAIEERNRKNI